ncbi:MAG: hypothetical protein EHM61_03250 [Acidobacteria bacterium]|nr:MAG: hypothetical protein EHM61_03250 [Acidobacteriota bacterium]
MPTEYIIWMVVAGVVGLILGFAAGYFLLRNSGSRNELMSVRSALDQKNAQLEDAHQRISAFSRRVDEKDTQLRTANDEIHHLESRLEEKAQREKKAIEALREVARDEVATVDRRPVETEAEARRRAEARKVAEEKLRDEDVHDVRRK